MYIEIINNFDHPSIVILRTNLAISIFMSRNDHHYSVNLTKKPTLFKFMIFLASIVRWFQLKKYIYFLHHHSSVFLILVFIFFYNHCSVHLTKKTIFFKDHHSIVYKKKRFRNIYFLSSDSSNFAYYSINHFFDLKSSVFLHQRWPKSRIVTQIASIIWGIILVLVLHNLVCF